MSVLAIASTKRVLLFNEEASRSNLALVLRDLGERPRAKQLLEQALESNLRHLGEDPPSIATRRSNLAGVLQDLGDKTASQQQAREALRVGQLQPEGSYVRTGAERLDSAILRDP